MVALARYQFADDDGRSDALPPLKIVQGEPTVLGRGVAIPRSRGHAFQKSLLEVPYVAVAKADPAAEY